MKLRDGHHIVGWAMIAYGMIFTFHTPAQWQGGFAFAAGGVLLSFGISLVGGLRP